MPEIEITPDNVAEDSSLTPAEKETNIWFDKEIDKAVVYTREGGIMRRLLQHPEFDVNNVNEKDGKIVGVKGRFPIDAISFGSKPRKNGGHASMITNGVMNMENNATVSISD